MISVDAISVRCEIYDDDFFQLTTASRNRRSKRLDITANVILPFRVKILGRYIYTTRKVVLEQQARALLADCPAPVVVRAKQATTIPISRMSCAIRASDKTTKTRGTDMPLASFESDSSSYLRNIVNDIRIHL